MEPLLIAKQLPSDTHEVIVVLESIHVPWEDIDLSPKTHETLVYRNSVVGKDNIAARIKDASIIVCTIGKLPGEILAQAPHLKCILSHPVGTNHIDLEYCRKNNIQVMNCTGCNNQTVAEHAISLYFATRRSIVRIHNVITDFAPGRPNQWKAKSSLNAWMNDSSGKSPRTCSEEVAGIIGYGAVGKSIAGICKALGMKVIISDRKNAPPPPPSSNTTNGQTPPRLPFTEVLKSASVIFLTLPLVASTHSLISSPELSLLAPDSIIINVSRGGIVDEAPILEALKSRSLFGYGTDVFCVEPAGSDADSVLLSEEAKGVNLVMTGHEAWVSDITMRNQMRRIGENLRWFVEGAEEKGDVVVPRRKV